MASAAAPSLSSGAALVEARLADSDGEGWEEDEEERCFGGEDGEDAFGERCQSLFTSTLYRSGRACVESDKETHGVDVVELCKALRLDFYGRIKLVNCIRREVKSSAAAVSPEDAALVKERLLAGDLSLDGEDLLRPVLENDGLLLCLEDLVEVEDGEGGGEQSDDSEDDSLPGAAPLPPPAEAGAAAPLPSSSSLAEMEGLRKENALLREALADARAKLVSSGALLNTLATGEGEPDEVDNDGYYFHSYAHFGIHETMLRDTVRTGSYERAIKDNPDLFKGKVVLDVGCGTGVLSMFAAQAGASRVIGVDMSDVILDATKLVADNGFSSDVITLLQGKMEEVKLPVDKVDIIVSEWMGYCLFYETMLPAVLYARDTYLRPGGVVLPNKTPLFVEAMKDPDKRLEWWKDVHGLDYTRVQELVLLEAGVENVDGALIVTDRCLVKDFDLMGLVDSDLDFEAPFTLIVKEAGPVSGLIVSFDVGFDAPSLGLTNSVWFSTGPHSKPTHWKQTLLWFAPSGRPVLEVGDVVTGTLKLARAKINPREIDIEVVWSAKSAATGKVVQSSSQTFVVQ